jgi:hypothetical protein
MILAAMSAKVKATNGKRLAVRNAGNILPDGRQRLPKFNLKGDYYQ